MSVTALLIRTIVFGLMVVVATNGLAGTRTPGGAVDGVAKIRVVNLRTEYKDDPIGIDDERPRLSWQLKSTARGIEQSAYQVRVAMKLHDVRGGRHLVFDSGKVVSEMSTQLSYNGPQVESRQRYYWQVRVWDSSGAASEWSAPAFFEMGLLSKKDWQAQWIQPRFDQDPLKPTPAPMLRSEFQLEGEILRARAYVTGLGLYELYLNGERVGNETLTPGWTSYEHRLQYQTYDITALLKSGANAVGAVLGDGWYRRVSFNAGGRRNNSKPFGLLVQMEVTYKSGHTQTIVSNSDWRFATGPILFSELYKGELYDGRLERTGWSSAGYDDHDWSRVTVAAIPSLALIATVGPPVRRIQEIKPIRILKTAAGSGSALLDMGQNMAGWVRLKARGTRGTKITLRHAEVLDQEGELYSENLRSAQQRVDYTLKGQGDEVLEPHFAVQGFRYVAVDGYPGEMKLDDFTGVVVHSDMERVGTLETSDPLINRFYSNMLWSQKGNYIDVPTDCPQRDERLGFGFDAALFSATGALNMNVVGFFSKWLGDFRADQRVDGAVPAEIPQTLFFEFPARDFYRSINHPSNDTRTVQLIGMPGYGDAVTIIPWNLYLAYGDIRILRSQYASMQGWVRYAQEQAGEDYIWEPILSLGDWLDVSTTINPTKIGETPLDLIATAYFARSVYILHRTAVVLGEKTDAVRYEQILNAIRVAFQRRFVSADGRVDGGTQTSYVLALDFDLLPDALQPAAARHLALNVRSRGHLTTGLAGTSRLLSVLSRFGYDEEAYMLLNRREMPSWLYPITRGATTLWERWDGIRPDGSFQNAEMNSFNQYALGAIGEWLFGVMAGITTDLDKTAYKHSLIQPKPGGGLSRVKAGLETVYGHLSSEWRFEKERFALEIEIPPNTCSTVRLPHSQLSQVRESGRELKLAPDVANARQEGDDVLLEIGSGRYQFAYPWRGPTQPVL